MQLHHTITDDAGADAAVSVHRVQRDWIEGTGSGGGTADGATWNTFDSSTPWTTQGGDYDPAVVASSPITAATGDWESWDISTLVRDWVDGSAANHGLLLKGSGTIAVSFASKEDADAALHPKLSITYACECGSPCLAPQGNGTVLMVVVNPTTLVSMDAYKKALFESWGYTVTVVGESANQATYDTALATADVVFISETVNENQVGTKLQGADIAVVSQDGIYNDDLGIATGNVFAVASAINLTDTSHYITSVFPQGSLDIYSGAMEQLTVSGSTGPDLQTLADTAGVGSLVVLDTGAIGSGGAPLAGRRVMLPLGRDAQFNWDYLNANGRLLLHRALRWGMGADKLIGAKKLLLVVANAGSPTSQEDAKQALIESWGYPVTLIDDSDTQANFDAALASNDVAYISSTVSSLELGAKLTNAAIGVVNANGSLVEELGFGEQIVVYRSNNEIKVIENTHYITEPLPTGLLTISFSNQNLHMMTANKAPGFDALAEVFNTGSFYDESLGAIDAGGQLFSGGTATGRRVLLPWGDASFDVTALTSDGQTIMRRAIEWASTVADPKTPLAHWKLDEASGTTAVDSEGGHDGTLINGPVWTLGQIDGALGFDGNNDHVVVADAPSLDISNKITLSAWVKPGKTDTQYVIRKAQYSSTDGYELSLSSTGKSFFRLNQASSGDTYRIDSTSLYPNDGVSWMHIAGTYDGAVLRLYINGVEEASLNAIVGIGTNATDLSIGAQADGSGVIEGAIDDVKLFQDALTAEEVAALASGGSGGGAPGPDGCNGTLRDNFDTATWSGSSGTLDWSTSPWAEVGETDGAGNGDVSIIKDKGDSRLRIRDSQNGGEGVERVADLDGAATATLSLDYRRDGLDDSNDYVAVFLSTNGTAGPWDEIVRFQGADNDSKYQSFGQDISGYISAHTAIRLRSSTSLGDTDTVWFDNIQIECKP
jgi:hypothetical protein